MAVDLALVADVLPDSASVAKDLGVMNIAGALPFSIGPALAPMVLAAVASYVWWKSGRTRALVDASYAAVVTGSSTTSPAVGGWVS